MYDAKAKHSPITAVGMGQNTVGLRLLADHTIGRAFGTLCRLSVVCLSVVCL